MMEKKKDEISRTSSLSFEEKIKTAYFVLIAVFIPLVRLQIVSNATVFDFINMAFILFFVVSFFKKRKFQIPLMIPFAVILIGSLISMLSPQVLLTNSITLIKDLYLFIFFLVLYNLIETKKEIKIFILLWAIFAALQGIMMLQNLFANFSARVLGTFLNPNMAASYLGLSFFLLLNPYIRIKKLLAWIPGILILGGLVATKSLAGFMGILTGVLAVVILYFCRTGPFSKNKLVAAVLIVVIIGTASYFMVTKVPTFMSRSQRTFYSRIAIWQTALGVFIKNPLGLGIGPGGFKEVGPEIKGYGFEPEKKELHSDWISFLVERGVFGFIGILLLFGAIFRMLLGLVRMETSKQELLWIIGLWGMFIFILSFSLTHEVLHFRHVWTAFALIAVEYKLRMNNQQEKQPNLTHG